MTDRFVFQHGANAQNVLNALNTPRGLNDVYRVVTEFSSLADVLHHTQGVGDSTVIHMPDGNNVAFVHAGPRAVGQAAYNIAVAGHFNIT